MGSRGLRPAPPRATVVRVAQRPEHVFWIEGPRRRAKLRLRGSFFMVGRLEPFAVFRDDPMISREHLAVVATDDGVRVRDLGSQNGVLLNGKRLERYAEAPLRPGDVLHAGQTSMRLLREGELEAPGQTLSPGKAPEGDEVEVDEEGHTKPNLAAILDEPAGGSSADLVEGEATGELDVPDEAALEAAAKLSSQLKAPAAEALGPPSSVEAETIAPGPPRERPPLDAALEAALEPRAVDREAETISQGQEGAPGRGTEGSLGTGKVQDPPRLLE